MRYPVLLSLTGRRCRGLVRRRKTIPFLPPIFLSFFSSISYLYIYKSIYLHQPLSFPPPTPVIPVAWEVVVFEVPLLVCLCLMSYFSYKVAKKYRNWQLWNPASLDAMPQISSVVNLLFLYPLGMFVSWIPYIFTQIVYHAGQVPGLPNHYNDPGKWCGFVLLVWEKTINNKHVLINNYNHFNNKPL